MTTAPAVQWLDEEFTKTAKRRRRDLHYGSSPRDFNGPSYIRPIIQLRSVMDGGVPMRVAPADYDDLERWWL